MKKTFLTLSVFALILVLLSSSAFAGTTVIQVNTDEGGDVDTGTSSTWDNNYENVNGAMFWNGEKWVVNDTYGHMYFQDLRTNERIGNYGDNWGDTAHKFDGSLGSDETISNLWAQYSDDVDAYNAAMTQYNADLAAYNAALAAYDPNDPNAVAPTPPTQPTAPNAPISGQNVTGNSSAPVTIGGYTITETVYSYSIGEDGGTGGIYAYQNVEYKIEQPDGTTIYLKSRGSGQGTGTDTAYFNVYIEDTEGNTNAMRGDPVWFTYNNMDSATARNQMDGLSSSNVSGNLPTVGADYWIDTNGGSEMGGMTYKMETNGIGTPNTTNLGSSFPTGFSIQFKNDAGELEEINFTPKIINETYIPPAPPQPSCCC